MKTCKEKIAEAYEEAVNHLEACASEESDAEQKRACREVSRRIEQSKWRLYKKSIKT
jgi:hypothetical protein